jgi:hypothetical protein
MHAHTPHWTRGRSKPQHCQQEAGPPPAHGPGHGPGKSRVGRVLGRLLGRAGPANCACGRCCDGDVRHRGRLSGRPRLSEPRHRPEAQGTPDQRIGHPGLE